MSKMPAKDLEAFGAARPSHQLHHQQALLRQRWDSVCIISVGRNRDLGNWSLGGQTLLLLPLMEL